LLRQDESRPVVLGWARAREVIPPEPPVAIAMRPERRAAVKGVAHLGEANVPETRIWLMHWQLSLIRLFTPASTLVAILAAVRDCLRTRAALQIFKKAMTSASKIDPDPGWHTDRDPLLEKTLAAAAPPGRPTGVV
jgi:hypothetical protein